jgi:hypothetical protein
LKTPTSCGQQLLSEFWALEWVIVVHGSWYNYPTMLTGCLSHFQLTHFVLSMLRNRVIFTNNRLDFPQTRHPYQAFISSWILVLCVHQQQTIDSHNQAATEWLNALKGLMLI